MKIEIGNKVYYFTEKMLKDSEDGNIITAVERAFFDGKAVKMTVRNYQFEPEIKTREMTIYTPNLQTASNFLEQMKKAARGGCEIPKTAPATWKEIVSTGGTIDVTIERNYLVKGDWCIGKTTTQIR